MKKILAFVVAILILIGMFISCTTRIPTGYEGIKVNIYGTDRGVNSIPIVSGRVWYNPFYSNVYIYPTFNQTEQYDKFKLNLAGGTEVTVDPAITLSVIPGKAPFVYQQYHKEFEDLVGKNEAINLAIKNVFRDVLNEYTLDNIINNRQQFENELFKKLQVNFNEKGFTINQITSGLELPSEVIKSITDKAVAVQQAQVVSNQLQTSKALFEKAEIDAKTTQISASALTSLQVQEDFIHKWNGSAPLYFNPFNIFGH